MSNYTELKKKINSKIRTNGKQEITGAVLNDVLISVAGTVESDSNAINKTMAQINKNVSDSINAVNKNMADGFNTINGGINNEIRPSVSANTESIKLLQETVAAVNKNMSDGFNAINKNVSDSINTINGGIDNELRPAISANTESIKKVNEVLVAVNENVAESINILNRNMADSFNTINGGLDNEVRPAVSANTEAVSEIRSILAELDESMDSLSGTVAGADEKYQPKGEYALKSEIPSIDGLATDESLESVKTVAEKAASDIDYVGNTLIPQMNTNTATALDGKVGWDESKTVISLPSNGSISAMRGEPVDGTQPEGGNLLCQRTYDSGATYVTEVGTVKNLLTLNGSERPSVDIPGGQEKMAFVSDMPVEIQFPLRTLSDKVYTQEEILGFFGVSDIPSLKSLFAHGPLCYLKYGITLTYKPMYYRFPVHYMAFEDTDVIVLKFIGLDTNNDNAAKYTITMNLSGEVIDGNCNIKIEMKSLEQAS